MSAHEFDLIVIGGGSGGVAAARRAAQHGARVAICEQRHFGGTCVMHGCVPKKLYVFAAEFAAAFEDARGYGWDAQRPAFDLQRLFTAKQSETARLREIYRRNVEADGVRVFEGFARIADPHGVEVNGQRLSTARILVATGSHPQQPDIDGVELALNSDDILELRKLPESLLIVGGGYIATEFACTFSRFGSRVTMAYREELPMKRLDMDLRTRLASQLAGCGIELVSGFQAAGFAYENERLVCRADDGRRLSADVVLSAMGRRPNTANLGLEALGLDLSATRGAIPVDDRSCSPIPSIFAVGDATARLPLTPIAIAEGRAFADSEFGGLPRRVDHRLAPTAIFSQPPIGTIGLSEADAREAGHALDVYEAQFRPMKHQLSGRDEICYMKAVVDARDQRVLGLHMIGVDAAEIIQALSVAFTMGLTKPDLDRTLALHPTTAEEWVLMRRPRTAG